jgi:hypothetical protein
MVPWCAAFTPSNITFDGHEEMYVIFVHDYLNVATKTPISAIATATSAISQVSLLVLDK